MRKEMSARLDALESKVASGSRATPPPLSIPAAPAVPVSGNDKPGEIKPGKVKSFQQPTDRDVSVMIKPLHDLSMARVVEQALVETEGVEKATLRELRGDSAVIDTRVDDGVSLISSLRRKLPVAFDVTDSDKGSFTIALAQPLADRMGGVAAQDDS